MNMKKIFYLLFAGMLAVVSSCHQPEFIEPTVERQGITSLTAYFTSGKYTEMEMGKLNVPEGESPDRYVIPIPWFYPEESDDVTTLHMTKVRVRAELAENCSIYPPLTVLDLNQEHNFTYTNAQGESKPIVITGQRVKSSTTNMLAFNLLNAEGAVALEGFINNDLKEIYLFSVEDLNGLTATAEPWYHASIKDVESLAKPRNWNEDQTVTVIAHDGVTEGDFKVIKRNPEKIDYGINPASFKELFNIDPVSRIGVPPYNQSVYATLAYVGGNLVVSHGDGKAPVYLDARNGAKLGEIATGGLSVGAVTNDEGGNMLLCNRIEGAGTFEIYRTTSVNEAPTLFYSYNNEIALPMGSKIKVCGDINKNARITVSYEGVAGITEASQFLELTVVSGNVTEATVHNLAGAGVSWGAAPTNMAGLVPASSEAGVNGWYYASYSINGMHWIRPELTIGQTLATNNGGQAWLLNPNCLDSKKFNNANYLVLMVTHHFPAWEGQPSIWMYDIGDPATVSGSYQENASLVAYNSWLIYFNATNDAVGTQSAGDVVIAPSADGFKIFVYYYDHYAGTIGGYSADCVKK